MTTTIHINEKQLFSLNGTCIIEITDYYSDFSEDFWWGRVIELDDEPEKYSKDRLKIKAVISGGPVKFEKYGQNPIYSNEHEGQGIGSCRILPNIPSIYEFIAFKKQSKKDLDFCKYQLQQFKLYHEYTMKALGGKC